jgi:ankyrin repeat protein
VFGSTQTPFHITVLNGHGAVARLLVDRGANKEVTNDEGQTPLYVAALNGHEIVARLLIDNDADKEAENGEEWTPLHIWRKLL